MSKPTLSRRTFLGTASATAGTAAVLGRSGVSRAKAASTKRGKRPPEGTFVPTVCLQCDGGCGLAVRVVDGNAVKVDGSPSFPLNQGKTCPKGQAALQTLYDPDRLLGPRQRVGRRGEGRWKDLSWEAALKLVAERLGKLRKAGRPERLAVLHGRTRGQTEVLLDRFCRAYGTPNLVHHDSISSGALFLGHHLTTGLKADFVADLQNSRYVLTFGTGLLESSRPTVRQVQAYADMRVARPGQRAKLVQVEPRYSMTASRADQWIPIRPGTDGALALGLAHVIVRDELYDADFVANHCFGFDEWTDDAGVTHRGFAQLTEDYDPETVEELTGVPARTTERLAMEFATHTPAIALASRGATATSNSLYTCMAIDALNALVGSFDRPGGLLRQLEPPLTPLPEVALDETAEQGLQKPRVDLAGTERYPLADHVYQEVAAAIAEGRSEAPEVLLLYYTNPLFSAPNLEQWRTALSKIPFIVSFSPFMDDTTNMADLILPDHTFLERWQDDICRPGMGPALWGLRQPVVKPIHKTRDFSEVLLELAQQLGGTVAESLPWESLQELLKLRAQDLCDSMAGNIFATSLDDWWTTFTTQGFWYDETYEFGQWKAAFDTPSGKFEFLSQALHAKLNELAAAAAEREGVPVETALDRIREVLEIGAAGDDLYLPHYEEPRYAGDGAKYPYHFVTYKLMAHAEGRGANQPMLQEILGLHSHMKWDSWVEVAAADARKEGIADGQEVLLESEAGSLRTRARILPGAMPGVLAMPFELGHRAGGRWAKGRGANPNEILAPVTERLGGLAATSMTRVRLRKV